MDVRKTGIGQPSHPRLPGLAVALIVLMAAFGPSAAWAVLTFPALTGRVVDAAHILDAATVSALDAKLAAQEQKTSDQLVVATVPSLQGTSIEDYANQLFRHWGIGQKDQNNGILLLVAPQERKVRMEVGYGLEGVLPDAVAATIIQSAIIPAFKAGHMAQGVVKGADAILSILNLDPEEARARARAAEQAQQQGEEGDVVHVIVLVLMLAFWVFIFWRIIRSQGGGGPRGPGSGRRAAPISTWDWSHGSGGGWSGGGGGGGWSGGGGSSGGGGASGGW